MSTLIFDTLKLVNRLKTAGVSSVQADPEVFSEVFEANLSELVIKEDLRYGRCPLNAKHPFDRTTLFVHLNGFTHIKSLGKRDLCI